MNEVITSATNPLVKRIRRLGDRRDRAREHAFFVEGGQPVWRAVEAGWPIESLVVCEELLRNEQATSMVIDAEERGIPVARLSAELFGRISQRSGPGGIAAIVGSRVTPLADLAVSSRDVFVALENVGNPGNLGTIIRTADAAGAAGVLLIGSGADPFDPAAVKASMGSIFAVPVVPVASVEEFFDWTSQQRVHVVATSGSATKTHWDLHLRRPSVLLFGSEGPGLSDAALARADETVRIPMTGTAESLNLSIAVAVALYETQRVPLTNLR